MTESQSDRAEQAKALIYPTVLKAMRSLSGNQVQEMVMEPWLELSKEKK